MRGFILHPTYRVVHGRPEVHLYGTLESGTSFCVVDDRTRPYFFVPATAAAAAVAAGGIVTPTTLRAFDGVPVSRVEVAEPAHVPPLRRHLSEQGVPAYEADLRFAYRYLIDRGIRGAVAIDGPSAPGDGIGAVYRNPTLAPATWTPRLRVLSFDLETDRTARRLLAIGIAGLGADRVLLLGSGTYRDAECHPNERALLERFFALLQELDPDVLTGWNVVDFDVAVLQRLCRNYRVPFRLGRTREETTIQRDQSFARDPRVNATGRLVLDGLALLRSAFVRLEDYKLETAAQATLGRGKLMTGEGRGAEIEDAFVHDPQKLVDYNLRDAQLVLDIIDARHLIDLAVSRSLLTGMQPDRVGASIASVDSLYLGPLRERGYVAPSVGADPAPGVVHGGAVLDSVPGLFRNILVFDFKSLYPSIILTFNVDPLTFVPPERAGDESDLVPTPSGAHFRRAPGILPELVARLWRERDLARGRGDTLAAYATKILMNSLFGVLAAPSCRFFSPALANAITQTGQHVIQLAAASARALGHAVIYGDTDSLFVDVHADDPAEAERRAHTLRAELEATLAARLRAEFGVESRLELEYEKCYRRFWLPEVRQGTAGSKKRYAGLVADGDGERLEIVGLEAVRRDWTPLARRFQRELLERVFHDHPVEVFIREVVADLRSGRCDDELVYKKAIRKDLSSYTKTTPAHVKAARKQAEGGGHIVAYVVTTAGPEPVDARVAPVDYEHYVDRQLGPIADALLRFVGPSFDDIIGRPRQLDLL